MTYAFGVLDPASMPLSATNYTAVSAGTDLPDSLGSFYAALAEEEECEAARQAEIRANAIGILSDLPLPPLEGFVAQQTITRRALGL